MTCLRQIIYLKLTPFLIDQSFNYLGLLERHSEPLLSLGLPLELRRGLGHVRVQRVLPRLGLVKGTAVLSFAVRPI